MVDASGRPRLSENKDDQAYFPAQQPSSCQDARIPSSHAHPRRPRHSGCPSPQGTHRALGLVRWLSVLPRHHRLTRPSEISTVVSRGLKSAPGSVVIYLAPRADDGRGPRATVIASKALGNAPRRNRTKRRIRHVLSHMIREGTLVGPVDCVVRALPAVEGRSPSELCEEIRASITGSSGRG